MMNDDLQKVTTLLNSIWERLIDGLRNRYYKEDYGPFLEDYGIEIADGDHELGFQEYSSFIDNLTVSPSGTNIYIPYMASGEHAFLE